MMEQPKADSPEGRAPNIIERLKLGIAARAEARGYRYTKPAPAVAETEEERTQRITKKRRRRRDEREAGPGGSLYVSSLETDAEGVPIERRRVPSREAVLASESTWLEKRLVSYGKLSGAKALDQILETILDDIGEPVAEDYEEVRAEQYAAMERKLLWFQPELAGEEFAADRKEIIDSVLAELEAQPVEMPRPFLVHSPESWPDDLKKQYKAAWRATPPVERTYPHSWRPSQEVLGWSGVAYTNEQVADRLWESFREDNQSISPDNVHMLRMLHDRMLDANRAEKTATELAREEYLTHMKYVEASKYARFTESSGDEREPEAWRGRTPFNTPRIVEEKETSSKSFIERERKTKRLVNQLIGRVLVYASYGDSEGQVMPAHEVDHLIKRVRRLMAMRELPTTLAHVMASPENANGEFLKPDEYDRLHGVPSRPEVQGRSPEVEAAKEELKKAKTKRRISQAVYEVFETLLNSDDPTDLDQLARALDGYDKLPKKVRDLFQGKSKKK